LDFIERNMKILSVIVIWVVFMKNAYAYVDPGSGMLLWQGLVALIGAVLIFFRNPIQVIKSWIARIRNK
jgi:hypothetical protein